MTFCDVLSGGVKRELNLLLREDPFIAPGGRDEGWFCREHALLVCVVAEMLGHRAELATGHFAIVDPPHRLSSFDAGADHAWNVVDGVGPIDASLSTLSVDSRGVDVELVCPDHPGLLAGYELLVEPDADMRRAVDLAEGDRRAILYREERRFDAGAGTLLRAPYEFLLPPPEGMPTLSEAFGADILHAISWHSLMIHRRVVRSIEGRHGLQGDALRAVYRAYPNARANVERELRRRRR